MRTKREQNKNRMKTKREQNGTRTHEHPRASHEHTKKEPTTPKTKYDAIPASKSQTHASHNHRTHKSQMRTDAEPPHIQLTYSLPAPHDTLGFPDIDPPDLPHTHYDVPTTDTYTQPRAHLHPLRTHHHTRWKHAREPHTPIGPRRRTSAMGEQVRQPANTR